MVMNKKKIAHNMRGAGASMCEASQTENMQ